MKVLLVVSSSTIAGTERHVLELAHGLRTAGIDAHVVCEPGGDRLDEEFEARDVPVHTLPLSGSRLALSVPPLARLSLGFDLVHAHLTHATAAAVAARAIAGRPVIETRHFIRLAHQHRGALRRLAGSWRRRAIDRGLELTIAPSQAVADEVPGQAVVVPHGIPIHPVAARREWRSRYLVVGRLEGDRNVALAVEAFALADLPVTATLTVVGDGSARGELEARAGQLGLADRVVFTGWVPDVAAHLAAADVFVAPAVEAFGLAALEAMAAALPVIAVDTGGVASLVDGGKAGIVVTGEPTEFAAAMSRLERDQSLARELGAAGRRRAERDLNVDRMVDGTVAAYRRVAQRSGSGPRVLRVYHSAVVSAWRERDREMRRNGADLTLVAPRTWPEGSQRVALHPGGDDFVVPARTAGRHPALFLYNPLPLWRLMRRYRFDVVDAHEEPYSLAAAEVRMLASLLQPSATLLLYSAQNLAKRYPWPFRAIEKRTLTAATAVYVCNQAAGDVLRGKGFTGEIQLLPLGVDVGRFTPRPGTNSTDRFTVGYVGRLTPEKGVDVLVRAVAEHAGWHLVVAGDGPERGALETLAAGASAEVMFLGSVAHDDLPALYRSLDVLVVPSRPARGWLEQFCRVAVEGMASAVPIVASASGALPEVVGEAGVLVPPDDVDALAAALESLASDPERRRLLGQFGRERSGRFSWSAVAAAHRHLYEKTLCSSTS